MDHEKSKCTQLENQVGNISKKQKEYEMQLWQLIKDSGQKMEIVTSNLCVAGASLGKKSNEEIMSPNVDMVNSPNGPNKCTR